ncbi:facilitated trehalose transporter Tret1-like [Trichoplusia ni]|uniref:Facilitated trehalose transporter Tret1-like n=1 Tax=Trichoplusia ni TaxID=7111 RepID=A0A7E5WJ67_TRINI|nr:facilitated trehalose transporter Tret1-like [Trichoplusia ni]
MSGLEDKRSLPWIYFFRQLFICSGIWSCLFFLGLCVGSPTIIIPQLRREANSTDAVSKEMASWLSSAFSYSGIPWSIIIPILIAAVGRRITQTIVCVCSLIGFIILYTSSSVYLILISEIFQGALFASFLTISVIVITEYTSSQYRGIFLTLKSATFFWGVLISNTIGTFFHWRNIAVLGIICSSYSLLTILLWPESPLWLAKKRRFDECSKAHRWLKGFDIDAERELDKIIANNQKIYKKTSIRTDVLESIKSMHEPASNRNYWRTGAIDSTPQFMAILSSGETGSCSDTGNGMGNVRKWATIFAHQAGCFAPHDQNAEVARGK